MGAVEALTIVVAIFIFAIAMIAGTWLNEQFQATDFNDTPAAAAVLAQSHTAMLNFDYLIPMIVMGMATATLVSAYYVRSHPILFVFSALAMIFVVALSAQFTNIFFDITLGSGFNATSQQFPFTFMIFNQLPTITMVTGFVCLIVLVGKPSVPAMNWG